ncbi:MAG: protein kinase [Planctomycetota bacterium]
MNTHANPGDPNNNPGSPGLTALTLKPGDKVDHFEIVQQVGAGGAGVVFAAFDAILNRTVAIKQIIAPPGDEGDDLRQRAVHEAKIHRSVAITDRAMLVQFIDIVHDPRGVFLISEFVDGPTLEWILQSEPAPMEQRQALGIIAATSKALSSIHAANMVHRDLKPSNILMPRAGGLKVSDFGLAAALSDQQAMDLGSVRYMAPELLQGGKATTSSDIYALGIIAYEMLAGRNKFNEAFRTILRDQRNQAMRWVKWHTNPRAKVTPLSTLVPDIPQSLSDLVARMMEKEPARRIANTHELMEAIRLHFAGDAQGGVPTPQPHQTVQPAVVGDVSETAEVPKRSKVPMILVGMLVFWLLAIGGFFIYKGQERKQDYRDRIARLAGEVEQADDLHRGENNYADALYAFNELKDELLGEYEQSPESFKDEFTNLGRLSAAGAHRAQGQMHVEARDYVSALESFKQYKEAMQAITDDPTRLAQTDLTLVEADNLVDTHQRRAAFQENATEIASLLDEGKIQTAIERIRRQRDSLGDNLAAEDQATLDQLDARYRMLFNAEKNAAITQQAMEMVEDGDLDDAIDLLEDTISDDPEAASLEHTEMLADLKWRVYRAESDREIALAEGRNDIDELIELLHDRIERDPNPQEFVDRYERLINDRDTALASDFIEEGQLNRAVVLLEGVLDRDPEHRLAQQLMAGIGNERAYLAKAREAERAFSSRNYAQAITLATEAIDLGGDRDGGMNDIITQSTGQLALSSASAELEDGNVEAAERQLSIARSNLGNTEQVLAIDRAITNLRDYRTLVAEGDVFFQRGEYGPAKRKYIAAREIFSNAGINDKIRDCDFEMWLVACDGHIQRRQWDDAESALTRAEALKTNAETRERRQIIEDRIQ